MLFTSLEYLLFLPIAVVLYWWLPAKRRMAALLLASFAFYVSFGVANLVWLGTAGCLTLVLARRLMSPDTSVRRTSLCLGIVSILALMFALKYYDPIAADLDWLPPLGLNAPVGFSFFAFTAIALLVDRYRMPAISSATFKQDLLYLAWFPKILAGPIERINPFADELKRHNPMKPAHFALGGQLILWGLVKKVVVADNLAPFVDRTYAIPEYAVPLELIIATYFFAFQIYCDFSGYTDMARGASQLFGIRLSENFRRSYFAQSISEFWARRWHISLSSWFRDYLYKPILGENRSALRMYIGLMLVFLASGIWHAGLGYGIGLGFVVWGLLNGLYLWVERSLSSVRRAIRARLREGPVNLLYNTAATFLVFHLVLVSWVFFRAGNISDGFLVLSRIWTALPEIPGLILRYPFTSEHAFLAGAIVMLLFVELVQEIRNARAPRKLLPRPLRWLGVYVCLFALLLLGRWQSQAFVYMQF